MLFGTQKIENNELHIGGLSVSELTKKHGTPLYVYDVAHIKEMITLFKQSFTSGLFNTEVAYASKAFLTLEMARLINSYNLSIDLVSLGEMYTAIKSGFNMEKAIIHGNNKTVDELKTAIKYNSLIIVDNIYELQMLEELSNNQPVRTLLRVNPGIEAHTHEYIVTAKLTSKFGESIFDKERLSEIATIYQNSSLVLEGFHCHIGSQIFGRDAFIETVDVMTSFVKDFQTINNIEINTLNLGGGFGVYYTEEDQPEELSSLLQNVVTELEKAITQKELSINNVIIEPGRSIVSNAGTTLYSIGYKKETYGGKNYLFIDGGMTDNIRPALYQAKYSCDIATNINAQKEGNYTIAGKLCESGDILIEDTALQTFTNNDILAIYTTGAYNYTMASNYNRMLKPEVIFVENGQTKTVVKRETLEDLIRNDL